MAGFVPHGGLPSLLFPFLWEGYHAFWVDTLHRALPVLNLLQQKFNRLEISLRATDGAMSEQEYKDKIEEAFRQMGIEIEKE